MSAQFNLLPTLIGSSTGPVGPNFVRKGYMYGFLKTLPELILLVVFAICAAIHGIGYIKYIWSKK